jgi:hypothetical protein
VDQVAAAVGILELEAAGQAVAGDVEHIPAPAVVQRFLQPLAGDPVLQHL